VPRARARWRSGDRSLLAAAKPRARWRTVDDLAPRSSSCGVCHAAGGRRARARAVNAKACAAPARETVLVEGRRPGVDEAVVFDETAAGAASGGSNGEIWLRGQVGSEGSRQRASEATSHARLAVDNAAVGRCIAEEHSIEAPPGPRGTTHTTRVATRLKLKVRRQAKLHPGVRLWPLAEGVPARVVEPRGPQGSRSTSRAHLGIGQSVGCSGRRSVAEVGETHLSRPRVTSGPLRGNPWRNARRRRWDSSRRPATIDEGGPGSRRATGCEGESVRVNNERDEPARIARSGSIRRKALWFVRCLSP